MKKVVSALATIALGASPLLALAQSSVFDIPAGGEALPGPSTISGIGGVVGILQTIANWLFTLLLIFAVIMIIWAAFNYLFSGGDDEKIKKANKMLLYAAVAVAVGLLAESLVFIIRNFFSSGVI